MREPFRTITVHPEACTGCRICELTCAAEREKIFDRGKARIRIVRVGLTRWEGRVCQLCERPACVVSCPFYAIEVADGQGAVVIDRLDCTGCGLCVMACPYGALTQSPRLQGCGRSLTVPLVCDFCAGDPRCVRACPVEGAISYTVREG